MFLLFSFLFFFAVVVNVYMCVSSLWRFFCTTFVNPSTIISRGLDLSTMTSGWRQISHKLHPIISGACLLFGMFNVFSFSLDFNIIEFFFFFFCGALLLLLLPFHFVRLLCFAFLCCVVSCLHRCLLGFYVCFDLVLICQSSKTSV